MNNMGIIILSNENILNVNELFTIDGTMPISRVITEIIMYVKIEFFLCFTN
jgi:hypothetical protein